MEQKAVKSNRMKAFRIFYISNGVITTIYKLKSTNGKQALQTFIRHHWNGLKYDMRRVDEKDRNEIEWFLDRYEYCNPDWVAIGPEGFATLFSEELA